MLPWITAGVSIISAGLNIYGQSEARNEARKAKKEAISELRTQQGNIEAIRTQNNELATIAALTADDPKLKAEITNSQIMNNAELLRQQTALASETSRVQAQPLPTVDWATPLLAATSTALKGFQSADFDNSMTKIEKTITDSNEALTNKIGEVMTSQQKMIESMYGERGYVQPTYFNSDPRTGTF